MATAWFGRIALGFAFGITYMCVSIPVRTHGAQQADPPPDEATTHPELAELVAAHNRERAAQKLAPLTASAELEAAARLHARDMADHKKMSHEGSDGSKFNERIDRQGYLGLRSAENVAWGQRTVAAVMTEWMNSPHHRENILGPYSEMGGARVYADDGTPYWCVDFGLPRTRLDPAAASAGVIEAVNRERVKAGKPPLKVNTKLAQAARKLSEDLAARGRLGVGDTTTVERIKEVGYRYAMVGESAAEGQQNPDEVVKTWLDSPSNHENFLGKFTDIGVGYATNEKGISFWAVFLGQPAR